MFNSTTLSKKAGDAIFAVRWILYPINIGLVIVLTIYVLAFLRADYLFIASMFTGKEAWDMENLMVMLLGFVDASMVANLIVMVVQGGHRIFIHRFDITDKSERPQWLDHIDSGILKVKIAMTKAEAQATKRGLYRVFWKSGGSSIAAVGSTSSGSRWLAACNWVGITTDQDRLDETWEMVDKLELIEGIDS
jgi:uncharacterized protein (TIGR00645 family)